MMPGVRTKLCQIAMMTEAAMTPPSPQGWPSFFNVAMHDSQFNKTHCMGQVEMRESCPSASAGIGPLQDKFILLGVSSSSLARRPLSSWQLMLHDSAFYPLLLMAEFDTTRGLFLLEWTPI